MVAIRRCISVGITAVVLAAALGGCRYSTAVFPYEREAVLHTAFGECVIWRPQLDEENFTIKSSRIGLGGIELEYELKVTRDLSLWSGPRTRVHVRMVQTKPEPLRFVQEEKILLRRIRAILDAKATQPPP